MLTDEEFKIRWNKLKWKQKKFVIQYCKLFDYHQAALAAGYSISWATDANYKIVRKVRDVIDYLLTKNNLVQTMIKPQWVLKEYKKLYENTTSQITKQKILQQYSKILKMMSENTTNVSVNNNIPSTPVQIVFNDNEKE